MCPRDTPHTRGHSSRCLPFAQKNQQCTSSKQSNPPHSPYSRKCPPRSSCTRDPSSSCPPPRHRCPRRSSTKVCKPSSDWRRHRTSPRRKSPPARRRPRSKCPQCTAYSGAPRCQADRHHRARRRLRHLRPLLRRCRQSHPSALPSPRCRRSSYRSPHCHRSSCPSLRRRHASSTCPRCCRGQLASHRCRHAHSYRRSHPSRSRPRCRSSQRDCSSHRLPPCRRRKTHCRSRKPC